MKGKEKSLPPEAKRDLPIMECISCIFENKERLFENKQNVSKVSQEIEKVAGFFELDAKAAVAVSVMLCYQMMGESTSIPRTMKSLGFGPIDHLMVKETIIGLRTKGWLRISSGSRYRIEGIEYHYPKEVIDAVVKNDPSRLKVQAPENQADALLQIHKLIINLTDLLEEEDIRSELLVTAERYDQFPLIAKLLRNKALTDIEKLILLFYSAESLLGNVEFNFNDTLAMFCDGLSDIHFVLRKIKANDLNILQDGYIRFVNPELADFSAVTLGEEIYSELEGYSTRKTDNIPFFKFCKLIQSNEIAEQTLYFNPEAEPSIKEILNFTSAENYTAVSKRLEEKGMNAGLTMMFYGPPGTGKTELVRQIARRHQLPILMVDIAMIKTMWVGESEKNLNHVFDEYQKALRHFKNTPILLFNEADGILGVRKSVQGAVDQMLNTMQNILLQKLETFTGIFIATTNLTINIDAAFDRRMLYKQRFDLPNENTRMRILENSFPTVSKQLLEDISRKYILSGGQIQNIRKKFAVDDILYGERKNSEETVYQYIEEETRFRAGTSNAIGYKIN